MGELLRAALEGECRAVLGPPAACPGPGLSWGGSLLALLAVFLAGCFTGALALAACAGAVWKWASFSGPTPGCSPDAAEGRLAGYRR